MFGNHQLDSGASSLELLNLTDLKRKSVRTFPVNTFSGEAYQFLPYGKNKILMPSLGYTLNTQGRLSKIRTIGDGLMHDYLLGPFLKDNILHCYQPHIA